MAGWQSGLGTDLVCAVMISIGDAPLSSLLPSLGWQDVGSQWVGRREESWLNATVSGPGILSFWWRTASGGDNDAIKFSVSGTTLARTTGTADWELKRAALRSGQATVHWRCNRGNQSSEADAAAWVDQVMFAPAPAPRLAAEFADDGQVSLRVDTVEGLA